jgi:hypothetical protein
MTGLSATCHFQTSEEVVCFDQYGGFDPHSYINIDEGSTATPH